MGRKKTFLKEDLEEEVKQLLATSDAAYCLWQYRNTCSSREVEYLVEEIEDILLSYNILIDANALVRKIEEAIESDIYDIYEIVMYSIESL
jgi:hypothetical protein